MATPETKLKAWVTREIKRWGGYSLPIPGGAYGVSGAPDRIVFYKGRVFAVEFKANGRKLGPKQEQVKAAIEATGCQYIVIREPIDLYRMLGLQVIE